MLKKTPLLLSTNDNKLTLSHITEINKSIISAENFDKEYILKEKDLNLFYLVLKLTDNNTLSMIDFIVKNTKKKYKEKEISRKKEIKIFLIKQILLLFKYLSIEQPRDIHKFIGLYSDLYKLILKFHNSFKLTTINDVIEIIRYNIIISMNDLINKNYIFNCSLKFLIDFYKEINEKKEKDDNEIKVLTKALIIFFSTLYKYLVNNKKNVIFLQRYENIENLELFKIITFYNKNVNENYDEEYKEKAIKLNDLINKIILLVFSFSYSKLINETILSDIEEGFFELKNGNDIKIKNNINLLGNKIHLINKIYENENDLIKNDVYFPKKYFVFNNSIYSGIDYNPEFDLFNYNFLLMFSFKVSGNNNYPLISFVSEENEKNESEILLNISLQNRRISILFQNEHQEFSNIEIQNDKSYLIVIEYFKNNVGFEKLKLIINNTEERKFIELGLIDYDKKVFVQLGHITEKLKKLTPSLENLSLNYSGIIGSVIIIPDLNNELQYNINEEEDDFTTNASRLKGFYDNYSYLNKNNDIRHLYLYENFKLVSDPKFIKANSFFNNLVEKDGSREFYIISPLSMINTNDHNTKIFIDNINGFKKSSNVLDIDTFYNTLSVPSKFSEATYAKMNNNSLQIFVQNDGIHILTLILEYYYNLLKMIMNYSQYDNKLSIVYDINNALIPLFDLITNIIMFFQIDLFSNDLDTFGFSLMKVIYLIGDIKSLNSDLTKSIINNMGLLINFYNNNISNTKISQVVISFINKIFTLLCIPKYYDNDNYEVMKNIFRLFHEILINNYELMNTDTLIAILQFSLVLDMEIDEDDNDKEFKLMKGEYKSLIELLIKQSESITFYLEFLKNVSQKNLSIKIKYKLIKIYYRSNEAISLLNNMSIDEKMNKFDENKDNNDKSFWNIFKGRKDSDKKRTNFTDDNLISIYDSIFTKVLAMRFQNNPANEKYHELLKCILIQLIFEQALYMLKRSEEKYYFFSEESINLKREDINKGTNISRGSIHQKSKSIKEMAKLRKSSHLPDGFRNTFSSFFTSDNEKDRKTNEVSQYLFDKVIEGSNITFYVVKSIFSCLFDKWDRNDKFNFFKNATDVKYESFDSNFGDFTRYKKELFSQFIDGITCINDKEEMKKSLKLVFTFLKKVISDYKSIEKNKNIPAYNIRYYKKKFYHLFESKSLMNKLFEFCLSSNYFITTDLCEFLLINIVNICNNVIEYHPRPFIFSFMKLCLKNKNLHKHVYHVFKGISEYIINNIKKDSELIEKEKNEILEEQNFKLENYIDKEEETENMEINSYLYYNEIRFVKCLLNIFKYHQVDIQKLLYENDFKFLNSIQNLIIAFCSSKFIFDSKLYIFHPNSLIQDKNEKILYSNYNTNNTVSTLSINAAKDDEKLKERYNIKVIQSLDSKILSNQILLINLIELIFLVMYILWTINLDDNDSGNQRLLHNFMKPIFEKIFIEEHFITYYLDIFNQKNFEKIVQKENIPNSITIKFFDEIPFKYQHWLMRNASGKDGRLFSALLFLIILKYQSLLILFEKNKGEEKNSKIDIIRNIFSNNINLAQNDLFLVSQFIEKIKDSKKTEMILEKEDNKDFKSFNKNYKYLINYVNKYKNNISSLKNENIDIIKIELEKKYIKEEEEKKRMKLNWVNLNKSTSNNDDENSIDNNSIKTISEIQQFRNEANIITDINKTPQKKLNNLYSKKDSFNKYYNKEGTMNCNRKLTNEFNINNNIIFRANINKKNHNFIDAEEPILCAKRDLILKKFGYFFFNEYFKDERFIKMKNYFMYLYPPSNQNNNYNGFEKQMKIKYPSILKNFSNCNNYYPRLFIRPDITFFQNENLYKSHEYLKIDKNNKNKKDEKSNKNDIDIYNYIMSEEENKVMHLEYGHGLLNQADFNLFSAGNIKEKLMEFGSFECEYINNRNTIQGNIKLIKQFLIFQTNMAFDFSQYETNSRYRISSRKEEINQKEKQIIIPIKEIEQIIYRNFLFYNQALEIFLYNGKSYFFNLYEQFLCNDFINKLKDQYENYYPNREMIEIIDNPIEYFNKKKYCNNWLDGKISTLDYLLLINKYSGRSYNDLTQYLIFPWVLNNYSDINNKNNYRKMNLSMAIQDQENLEVIKESYDNDKDLIKRSHFQYHYSNSSYISLYLLRLNPFTYNQIKQNGHFDSPDRQIESMQDMCIVFKSFKETSELIPEYFFMVECFLNLNYNFFGKKSSEGDKVSIVNNIKLTCSFSSLLELLLFHQNFINSNEITGNINKWIDNIFGENQITTKKNVVNSYPVDCYEKYVKEEIEQKVSELKEYLEDISEGIPAKIKKIINDIKHKTDYAYLFGQCPPQIFQKTHPIFSFFKKNRKVSTNYDENSLKNDANIKIPNKQLLYLGYKVSNTNMFILTINEILVYNKLLKPIQTLNINKINQPYNINIEDNNLFLKFLYKNIIFEIEDCKIFFIGGYLDNSFKIYYKEKEKDNIDKETMMISIMTESQITCIKNIEGKNIFFTGHKNGKITKWKYDLLLDKNKNKNKEDNPLTMSSIISIDKLSSIIGHKSYVQIIDINNDLNILISASNDGYILIRKTYDYELLNVIKYNSLKRTILDFCFDKQIIIVTYFNNRKNKDKKIKINTYSINGIKLSDLEQNISMPIILLPQTDEIIVFIDCYLYKLKITFKEFTDLLGKLTENKNYDENDDENPTKKFINEINQIIPISLHYDYILKIFICLLQNGQLYRINIKS